jgi:hypothetical protein
LLIRAFPLTSPRFAAVWLSPEQRIEGLTTPAAVFAGVVGGDVVLSPTALRVVSRQRATPVAFFANKS